MKRSCCFVFQLLILLHICHVNGSNYTALFTYMNMADVPFPWFGVGTPPSSTSFTLDIESRVTTVSCHVPTDFRDSWNSEPSMCQALYNQCVGQRVGNISKACAGHMGGSARWRVVGTGSKVLGDDDSTQVDVGGMDFLCQFNATASLGVLGFAAGSSTKRPSFPELMAAQQGLRTAFSYCIPSYLFVGHPHTFTYITPSGHLLNVSTSTALAHTHLFIDSHSGSYAISVKGINMKHPDGRTPDVQIPGRFQLRISTLQRYSKLETRVFTALRSAFRQAMRRYGFQEFATIAPSDTCIDFFPTNITYDDLMTLSPSFQFTLSGGTIYTIKPINYIYASWKGSHDWACLGFLDAGRSGQPSVLGTLQQQDFIMLFDISQSTLSFKSIFTPGPSQIYVAGASGCSQLLP